MKIAIAHNRYRSDAPSGENLMVDAEMGLLTTAGHTVVPFVRDSDELAAGTGTRVRAGLGTVYAREAAIAFNKLCTVERPDVVHIHNVFPLISPYIIRIAKQRGIPVVQTVHNYRLTCVNGLHMRDGGRCDDCVGRRIPTPALVHGCYRGSRAQTVPMAASSVVHRGTWRSVDRFLALTRFMEDRLVRGGIRRQNIVIRPTWVPDRGHQPMEGSSLLYVGRLDRPKGVALLLAAWDAGGRDSGRTLQIAGDGPLRDEVQAFSRRDASVQYLGRLGPADVGKSMRDCAAVVVPSVVYEGFPLTVAEAFGQARPVLVTGGGSAASVVSPSIGWVSALDPIALAQTMNAVTQQDASDKGLAARRVYEEELSPKAALASLLKIYEDVICEVRQRAMD